MMDIPLYPAYGMPTLGQLHPNPGQIWPSSHPSLNKPQRYANTSEMLIKGVKKNKTKYMVSGIPALPPEIQGF